MRNYWSKIMEAYIVLLGRAGLEYYDNKRIKYFVDSELCKGDTYDYAIYLDSIKPIDSDVILSKDEKIQIAEKVLFLCKQKKMKPQLF